MGIKGRLVPWQGLLGLLLVAMFWPLNWLLPGLRTAYLFFPLWLGYILMVDGFVFLRKQSSLLRRSPAAFMLLFCLSAPVWWLFEAINRRTQNWEYQGGSYFTGLEYFFLSSISFSTVMPAVFETAELIGSYSWMKRLASGRRLRLENCSVLLLFLVGLLMLGVTLAWPKYCYPFVWTSLVLVLEPINFWLGRRSLFEQLNRGDWMVLVSLALGALTCGFFWEMWNYYSYPRWIYHTPGAQFAHIFEMPLLGYGGYIPFAWELYALRNLVWANAEKFTI